MKLCIHCCTLHADEAVLCSACGMGLTGTPAEETRPVDSADRGGTDRLAIARFMWGWVLLGVSVPPTCILLVWLLEVPSRESLIPLLVPMLDASLGAWMIWSVARRMGDWKGKKRALMWAGGPLAGLAVSLAWLAGAALAFFAGFACFDYPGPYCGHAVFLALGFLSLSSLFVAPLVGVVIVVIDWHRRRFRSSRVVLGSR
jgi:hypothetical protein